jgi:hypothetical protein
MIGGLSPTIHPTNPISFILIKKNIYINTNNPLVIRMPMALISLRIFTFHNGVQVKMKNNEVTT